MRHALWARPGAASEGGRRLGGGRGRGRRRTTPAAGSRSRSRRDMLPPRSRLSCALARARAPGARPARECSSRRVRDLRVSAEAEVWLLGGPGARHVLGERPISCVFDIPAMFMISQFGGDSELQNLRLYGAMEARECYSEFHFGAPCRLGQSSAKSAPGDRISKRLVPRRGFMGNFPTPCPRTHIAQGEASGQAAQTPTL